MEECKACGGSGEVDIGRHLWKNDPIPQGAYLYNRNKVFGVWEECQHCEKGKRLWMERFGGSFGI